MITVEANLVSAIDGSRDDRLCYVEIANVRCTGPRADYRVKLYSRGAKPRLIKETLVEDWPRNALPAWRLIQAAFEALG